MQTQPYQLIHSTRLLFIDVRQSSISKLNLMVVQLADGSFNDRGMSLSNFLDIARSLCNRKSLGQARSLSYRDLFLI